MNNAAVSDQHGVPYIFPQFFVVLPTLFSKVFLFCIYDLLLQNTFAHTKDFIIPPSLHHRTLLAASLALICVALAFASSKKEAVAYFSCFFFYIMQTLN